MNKKELVSMIVAIATLISGHAMAFTCYFQHDGVIHDSVQWYFSQCLIYAGSFFGLTTYIHYKLRKS